ncbi:apoptotic chromatin condensation inducer in the nucleus [Cladorrhinum samala]|uniref:Apoptotic chromatin condensation inducer in the nucleus n=1 Tax=Cladorrhinum samala TaxID=585594 RepID=A0AAV9HWY5_9PEZI|nr:apoptotic chromatin condensation inducer in the nucleus [Cladorrhinum samala]
MATDFSRLTVAQLRQELKRRKLVQTGNKSDLIDRLVAFEDEQQGDHTDQAAQEAADDDDATAPEYGDTPQPDAQPADEQQQDVTMESPARERTASPAPEEAATAPPIPEVAEPTQPELEAAPIPDAVEASESLLEPIEAVDAEPSLSKPLPPTILDDSIPPAESTSTPVSIPATEIVQDIASRKRRSRSPPPPGDESSAKRSRVEPDVDSPSPQPETNPSTLDNQDSTAQTVPVPDSEPHHEDHARQERDWAQRLEGNQPKRQEVPMDIDEPMDEFGRVERSRHPATSALYISNLMRPLKDNDFRDHIIKIAAFPGVAPDPACVLDFYLDSIKTHAFVGFDSVSAASRVRTALHNKIYPNERIRKALWVDFIPPENIQEWVRRERAEKGRWVVTYEGDLDGDSEVRVTHHQATDKATSQQSSRPPMGPPPIPTGPSRGHSGGASAPPPPVRGRGARQSRYEQEGGDWKTTYAGPPLTWKPVSEELAKRRIEHMRSHYTTDRYRDMGREDEINRYTFENVDRFVDRGKEVFIGIRPPHRQAERDRLAGKTGGGVDEPRDRHDDDWPRKDSAKDRLDRYDDRRGGRDRSPDGGVPRSRFNGAPLPTYTAPAKGSRGGRRRNRH